MGRPSHNLLGQKFGRLTVKERRGHKGLAVAWLCVCDCGKEIVVTGSNLVNARGGSKTKSCGCLRSETTTKNRTKHGLAYSREYGIWAGMKSRCLNKNHPRYHRYGGRGIIVCDRWVGDDGFINFLQDMGERPYGLSLDRYPDNDGNYEPSNCRWATSSEQAFNRKRRFNQDDIRLIRKINISSNKLAKILGVNQSMISMIRSGKRYADIT